MTWPIMDASAIVKRYAPEAGSANVDYLFSQVARVQFLSLMLSAAEVVSALVRKRNAGIITQASFASSALQLRSEMVDSAAFEKLDIGPQFINDSIPLIEKYSISVIDACLLQTALSIIGDIRSVGDNLVLVAADQRLLSAAQAEGLQTFNPETQTQADLDLLIGP